MIVNETQIIDIIGEEQYIECMSLFQEMFERKSDYKIIMTRRCFSLYKIFLPILYKKGVHNTYGKIITDKALSFYSDEMNKNTTILIVDDIIIFGRTINSIIDNIIKNNRAEITKENLREHFLVRCIWQNKYNSKIKKVYKDLVMPQAYASKMDWKKVSCKFSTLIKYANIANTSYIISYIDQTQKVIGESDFYDYCKNYMIDCTTEELNNLNVKFYIQNAISNSKNSLDYLINSCSIRVYFYKEINSFVISPLVVLKDMSVEQMWQLCNMLIEHLGLDKYINTKNLLLTQNEQLFSIKMRMVNLILSHVLLCLFLKHNNLPYDSNKLDYREILDYNFNDSIANEFEEIGNRIYSLDPNSDVFCTCIDENIETYTNQIESYLFKQAMLDNMSAKLENPERIEGFSKIGNENIFLSKFMTIIISLIDSGKAALKSKYENNLFVSKIYAGEQAFRIMHDKFELYLKYLYDLERYADLYSLNPYSLYKNFIEYLSIEGLIKDEIKQSLFNYIDVLIDTDQQISDIYVYNIGCSDSSIEECMTRFIEKDIEKIDYRGKNHK